MNPSLTSSYISKYIEIVSALSVCMMETDNDNMYVFYKLSMPVMYIWFYVLTDWWCFVVLEWSQLKLIQSHTHSWSCRMDGEAHTSVEVSCTIIFYPVFGQA